MSNTEQVKEFYKSIYPEADIKDMREALEWTTDVINRMEKHVSYRNWKKVCELRQKFKLNEPNSEEDVV